MASHRINADEARETAALARLLAARLERLENNLGGRTRKRRKSPSKKRKASKAS